MHIRRGDVALGQETLPVFFSLALVLTDLLAYLGVIELLPPLVFNQEVTLEN